MSQYKTILQAETVGEFKTQHIVLAEECAWDSECYRVGLLCEMQDSPGSEIYYRMYWIDENGIETHTDYKPVKEEKYGDESFDVVVEEKLKEEKKMIDLKETYADMLENYISSHRDELLEYAEDAKRGYFERYAEDSLRDVIEAAIDSYFEYYDFDDITLGNEDIEQMLFDNDIL